MRSTHRPGRLSHYVLALPSRREVRARRATLLSASCAFPLKLVSTTTASTSTASTSTTSTSTTSTSTTSTSTTSTSTTSTSTTSTSTTAGFDGRARIWTVEPDLTAAADLVRRVERETGLRYDNAITGLRPLTRDKWASLR